MITIKRMRSTLIVSAILVLNVFASNGQGRECSTITIGNLFELIDAANAVKPEILVYKNYSSFDFSLFEPIKGSANSRPVFQVGRNKKGDIREVIIQFSSESSISHKLLVHEFDNCRILLYKIRFKEPGFGFVPAAFVMMKATGSKLPKNYMINFAPQFGDSSGVYSPGTTYDDLPPRKLENISAVMCLGETLDPIELIRIGNKKIVMDSEFIYSEGKSTKFESVSIFFGGGSAISLDTCLHDVYLHRGSPDIIVRLKRVVYEMTEHEPVWIFAGAHEYE